MIDKKIIICGSGAEVYTVLKKLYNQIEIVAFIVDSSTEYAAKDSIKFCNEHGIPLLQHYTEIDKYDPDFIFMVSYPPLITKEYLEKFHFINVHNALLPRYRGFHGQTWALINGERQHGYSVHLVDEGIDSGAIYYQDSFSITDDDDIIDVKDRCFSLFEQNIETVLLSIFTGKIAPVTQNEDEAIYVTKRHPEDSLINWDWDSKLIFNHIRALTKPYTEGAYTFFKGEKVRLIKAKMSDMPNYYGVAGKILSKSEDGVLVKTGTNPILIEEISINNVHYNPAEYFKTVGVKFENK